jgi:hypothetical protein
MELSSNFEHELEQAFLDEVVDSFTNEGGPIWAAVEKSHEVLREYGREYDYDVGPVIESLSEPAITRSEHAVEAYWGWHHPGAPHFAYGTDPHPVTGSPLSFVWENPPADAEAWLAENFEREGDGYRVFLPESNVSGLPESRFVREGLNFVRHQLRS